MSMQNILYSFIKRLVEINRNVFGVSFKFQHDDYKTVKELRMQECVVY